MAMLDETPVVSGLSGVGIVLEGVSWKTYERLLQGIGDGRVRVTYDNGLMEIEMSPSRKHESDADFLRSLVALIRRLAKIPAESGGSTTHKRKDLVKGLEPDGCYWIANERAIRGVQNLDLTKHPPPDLVIEVDLTSRSVNKIPIYAALGVPEIWHVNEAGELVFLSLDHATGDYKFTESSISFPFLPLAKVGKALRRSGADGETVALDDLIDSLGL
ncbi:MAG: Uma2 family endonuclease [Planctomycetota bacterium]